MKPDDKTLFCSKAGCKYTTIDPTRYCPNDGEYCVSFSEKCKIENKMADEWEREVNSKRNEYPIEENEGEQSNADSILLNPIIQADRFGQGWKDEDLYFGVPVSNARRKIIPAVFYRGKLIYGQDNLESAKFNFGKDFMLVSETWNRTRLHGHIKNPQSPTSTKGLLDRIIEINKKCVFHQEQGWHRIIAAIILFSYLFTAFRQAPRIVFIGLPGSGKSTECDVMGALAANPIMSADMSKASLYRSVESMAGLVVVDNFDNISEEVKYDFTQLFDTSFEDNRPVLRCDDKTNQPKSFRTFCPLVLNCVDSSWMKPSSFSRSIIIRMIINNDTTLEKLKNIQAEELEELKHQARIWALTNVKRIRDLSETISDFKNRDGDIARPILAILKDADESYYSEGKSLLERNFSEHHISDENSPDSLLLLPLWNRIWEIFTSDRAAVEIKISVDEMARLSLAEKGITQTDEEGNPIRGYDKTLGKERLSVSHLARNFPYTKRTKPNNKSHFHFNVWSLARFVKSRGFEINKEADDAMTQQLSINQEVRA